MNLVEASKLQVGSKRRQQCTSKSLGLTRGTDWMIMLANARLRKMIDGVQRNTGKPWKILQSSYGGCL
jgi:hypothetical protein